MEIGHIEADDFFTIFSGSYANDFKEEFAEKIEQFIDQLFSEEPKFLE